MHKAYVAFGIAALLFTCLWNGTSLGENANSLSENLSLDTARKVADSFIVAPEAPPPSEQIPRQTLPENIHLSEYKAPQEQQGMVQRVISNIRKFNDEENITQPTQIKM